MDIRRLIGSWSPRRRRLRGLRRLRGEGDIVRAISISLEPLEARLLYSADGATAIDPPDAVVATVLDELERRSESGDDFSIKIVLGDFNDDGYTDLMVQIQDAIDFTTDLTPVVTDWVQTGSSPYGYYFVDGASMETSIGDAIDELTAVHQIVNVSTLTAVHQSVNVSTWPDEYDNSYAALTGFIFVNCYCMTISSRSIIEQGDSLITSLNRINITLIPDAPPVAHAAMYTAAAPLLPSVVLIEDLAILRPHESPSTPHVPAAQQVRLAMADTESRGTLHAENTPAIQFIGDDSQREKTPSKSYGLPSKFVARAVESPDSLDAALTRDDVDTDRDTSQPPINDIQVTTSAEVLNQDPLDPSPGTQTHVENKISVSHEVFMDGASQSDFDLLHHGFSIVPAPESVHVLDQSSLAAQGVVASRYATCYILCTWVSDLVRSRRERTSGWQTDG